MFLIDTVIRITFVYLFCRTFKIPFNHQINFRTVANNKNCQDRALDLLRSIFITKTPILNNHLKVFLVFENLLKVQLILNCY